jgi:hypothetical protein
VAVAVGDFNGDGHPDLAVANSGSNNVSVLLGNGAGGFAPAPGSPVPAGARPAAVAVGDFNGDGKADLAIADQGSNKVTVLLGDGAGGFRPAPGSLFPVGGSPSSVAVGDFNRDGKLDLAVADTSSNDVSVLLGNGSGGFSPAPGSPFPTGAWPSAVVAGDFNADGKTDLAVVNQHAGTATVLLGDGSGGFKPASGSPFPAGSNPEAAAVGDFNGDGKPDLAIADNGSASVTVLLGNGSGGFSASPAAPFLTGFTPNSVVASDFDGDNKLDLAVANTGTGDVSVLIGSGAGGFAPGLGSPFRVGSGPVALALGDFNGDRRPDLAVVNNASNNVSVLLNTSTPPIVLAQPPAPTTTGVIGVAPVAPEPGTFTATATFTAPTNRHTRRGRSRHVPRTHRIVYGTGTATATGAGRVSLVINPTRAGRAALRRHGHLTVTVHLAFRSRAHLGSTASTKDFRTKLSTRSRRHYPRRPAVGRNVSIQAVERTITGASALLTRPAR